MRIARSVVSWMEWVGPGVVGLVLTAGSALAWSPLAWQSGAAPVELEVNANGKIVEVGATAAWRSPLGTSRIEVQPVDADIVQVASRVRVSRRGAAPSEIERVVGAEIWATDVERLVVLGDHCSNVAPRALSVLDLDGRVLHSQRVSGVADPAIAGDGAQFVYRSRAGVIVLDLVSFEEARYPSYDRFAVGRDRSVVGVTFGQPDVIHVHPAGGGHAAFPAPERVRELALDGASLLVMGERTLTRLRAPGGEGELVYAAAPGAELRDLHLRDGAITLGTRMRSGRRSVGQLVTIGAQGVAALTSTASIRIPSVPDAAPHAIGEIPWPLAPNRQHPIGNSYAEFQRYGGSPYMHPGIDVLGDPLQPVFAVAGGEVKAVLTTSGQYHWRVAIANVPGAAPSTGYLYAHLVESSITVSVGDIVAPGDFLGDLVPWPVADFTHTHFARIEDSGAQWQGAWRNTDNPHLELPGRTESTAPVFEPAVGGDTFAFCRNETSSYLNPNSLRGSVDIIAHVGDTIDASWVCAVQTLRYSIHPVGSPGAPVVDNRLTVAFDMPTDTYANGPIDPFLVDLIYKQDSTCPTEGDYGSREFFYVLTNSDGDEVYEASDMALAWETGLVPDGDYVIEATATDAAGNRSTATMTVTVDNP